MTSNRLSLNATSFEMPFDDRYLGMEFNSTIGPSSEVQHANNIQTLPENQLSSPYFSLPSPIIEAQPNTTVCQQCTDNAARLEVIEYRLHALERLAQRRQEAALSSSSTPNVFDSIHPSNSSTTAYVPRHDVLGSNANALMVEPSRQIGQPSLAFTVDSIAHNGVEGSDGNVFDDMFDFNLAASPALDQNIQSDTYNHGIETQDFDSMVAGTPFDTAIADPAAGSTQSNALSATPMVAVAPPRPRFQCPNCGRMFLRPGDRDRHALKHNPNAQRYPCTYLGCRYSGMRAFLRKDKLREHRARHGH